VANGIQIKTDILDCQPVQGEIDSNLKEGNNECSSTSGVLDTLKVKDTEHKCDCENISVIVHRKSPNRPRRQPVTKNKDFLWTSINKY
jgi:hypothetical protein